MPPLPSVRPSLDQATNLRLSAYGFRGKQSVFRSETGEILGILESRTACRFEVDEMPRSLLLWLSSSGLSEKSNNPALRKHPINLSLFPPLISNSHFRER